MDNRINEIRKQIRLLRASMLEAESVMREQIQQDQDCSEAALRLLAMRGVMSGLACERGQAGGPRDHRRRAHLCAAASLCT